MTDLTKAIYFGTKYYGSKNSVDYGMYYGWSNFEKHPGIPYPPEMWFTHMLLEHMKNQLFSVRNRYRPDPEAPGWTYGKKFVECEECVNCGAPSIYHETDDYTHVRFDDMYSDKPRFWIWTLTGETKVLNDCLLHKGVWSD